MDQLLQEIRGCTVCSSFLEHGTNPVLAAHPKSKIAVIGQAPGRIVHASGVPWDDKSGENLRNWLGVTPGEFYNEELFTIIPMGFCYPGTGKSGDLPPRKECAPLWHSALFDAMEHLELILLIGKYAQDYYLPKNDKFTLTKRVEHFREYLPKFFVLPHPSPRNNIWQARNPWFGTDVLPELKNRVNSIL